MLYIDSSAFAKRYLPGEPEHHPCIGQMSQHRVWGTSRLTWLETLRTLGRTVQSPSRSQTIDAFEEELANCSLVDVDRVTLAMARDVAASTDAKSLDAIHIASALRVADGDLHFLTYDRHQARAAEAMGLRLAT